MIMRQTKIFTQLFHALPHQLMPVQIYVYRIDVEYV